MNFVACPARERTRPWLTVVMPVHHGEHYLGKALESVANEADGGVEIILIDSSDDDGCRDIIDRYMDRIWIDYSHRPDLKPWQAKTNEGVRRARAPFVSMLHQDDLWLPGRVAAIRASVHTYPDAVMHISPSSFIDDHGRNVGLWRCPLDGHSLWESEELAKRLLVQNFVAIPAPVIRREDWLAVGGMDETLWYTADWDLYLKLTERGDFSYTPRPTTAFRVHSRSLTMMGSKCLQDFRAQMETVVARHLHRLPSGATDDGAKLAHASVAINAALASIMNGNARQLWTMLRELMRLRPTQLARYLHYSRLLERMIPRVRMLYGAAR